MEVVIMKRQDLTVAAAIRSCVIALSFAAVASPAVAQWTPVADVPTGKVFSVWANGDTILAGTTTRVFVSTDAGASFHPSSTPAAGVVAIEAARIRNGRLYAGTFGQGVFISDDLGATWQGFNQGLVGGILDSQLDVTDLEVRGDNLYAGTAGASVYVRNLAGAGTWSPLGSELETNQAPNVNSLALGGTRLLAMAGGNGTVFINDPGANDWTISLLGNIALLPGEQAQTAAFTGSGWVVGIDKGVFRSVAGQEPWTLTNTGISGGLLWSAFAVRQQRLFVALDIVNIALIENSDDDGATWHFLDGLPDVFVFKMAFSGTDLYAGRADGLWRRSTSTVSVPGDVAPAGLQFAIAGAQPVGDIVRFRFELPEPGNASLEVFDVTGRRAADTVQGSWSAGTHELSWNARNLGPGVFEARLTSRGRHQVLRLVHVR
jgi:hypothetical protein